MGPEPGKFQTPRKPNSPIFPDGIDGAQAINSEKSSIDEDGGILQP